MNTEIAGQESSKLNLWIKIGGCASLVMGFGLGLLTLSSAAGVWLGFWDFSRGFSLLSTANQYGKWLAWACLAITRHWRAHCLGRLSDSGKFSPWRRRKLPPYSRHLHRSYESA
jgi:hypothetical protein